MVKLLRLTLGHAAPVSARPASAAGIFILRLDAATHCLAVGLLFAATLGHALIFGSVARATAPTPHPGTLGVTLFAALGPNNIPNQGLVPIGVPFPVNLALTRNSDEVRTIYVLIETFDADLVPGVQAGTGKRGELVIDVSGLPVDQQASIPFSMTLRGGEGGGAHVVVADDHGAFGEDYIHFANLDNDFVTGQPGQGQLSNMAYEVPDAGDILQPQIDAFSATTPWAQQLVTGSTTLNSRKRARKYTPTQTDFMQNVEWDDAARRAQSEAMHLALDAKKGKLHSRDLVPVNGRIVFPDDAGCGSASPARQITWTECHKFKSRIDSAGKPVTTNAYVADTNRPLPATLVLSYRAYFGGAPLYTCDVTSVQTNADGTFSTSLLTCPPPSPTEVAPDEYRVIVTAFLQYQVIGASGSTGADAGYIRGYWKNTDMAALFAKFIVLTPLDVINWLTYTDPTSGDKFSMPALRFEVTVDTGPFALGTRVVAGTAGGSYNYVRNLLSAYATMVQLHRNLRTELSDSSRYLKMFIDTHPSGLPRSYVIAFADTWAYGGAGSISLLKPTTDLNPSNVRLLSDTGTLSHELGHSIHGSLAGSSFRSDYNFANPLMRSDGKKYDWGHGFDQYQEMGTAFVEGIASSLGQYLLNGCGNSIGTMRGVGGAGGGVAFLTNLWSAVGTDSADGEPLHHTRWQLRGVRSLGEPSAAFTTRRDAGRALARNAWLEGHRLTTSNNEARWAEFGCDLMDGDSSVDYVKTLAPSAYVDDFSALVWETHQGDNDGGTYTVVDYVAPKGEKVNLALRQVVNAMDGFCPTCPTMTTDQTKAAYKKDRLAASTALQSPSRFAQYFIDLKVATAEKMRDVLRANFMETTGLDGVE
jgi:hypothetical protein